MVIYIPPHTVYFEKICLNHRSFINGLLSTVLEIEPKLIGSSPQTYIKNIESTLHVPQTHHSHSHLALHLWQQYLILTWHCRVSLSPKLYYLFLQSNLVNIGKEFASISTWWRNEVFEKHDEQSNVKEQKTRDSRYFNSPAYSGALRDSLCHKYLFNIVCYHPITENI